MAFLAVRMQRSKKTPQNILPACNSFKVQRIYAGSVSADVVYLKTIRNLSSKNLVGNPVGSLESSKNLNSSVAIHVFPRLPLPAFTWGYAYL